MFERPGSQHTCPGCGKRKEFTRYIDTKTGELLPDHVGICNNVGKCGYGSVKDGPGSIGEFFRDNPDYLQNDSFIQNDYIPRRTYTPPPPKRISYFPREPMAKSLSGHTENNFVAYLHSIFPREIIFLLIDRYKIGTSHYPWKGSTIFWQVDRNNLIRSGKIMLYNQATGKRVTKPYNHFQWAHTLLKKFGKTIDFNLEQCFFGEQLVQKADTIAVVASEKTAIIASVYIPEYTWIASGSKGGLSEQKCKALEGKTVFLYPDKGCFSDWEKRVRQLGGTFNVGVSDFIERLPDVPDGYDLADYFRDNKFTIPEIGTNASDEHDLSGSLIHPEKGFPAAWI